jgi:hypothetical protein
MAPPVPDARNIIVYAILTVCFIMLLVYMIPVSCNKAMVENFQVDEDSCDQPKSTGEKSCPPGSKAYTDVNGNINCCNGEVNGAMCDGPVMCTFSSNLMHKYVLCGSRKRKYNGRVDSVVRKYMAVNPRQKFRGILQQMSDFWPRINQLLTEQQISQTTVDSYRDLFIEEKQWFEENKKVNTPLIYQEEVMYIMKTLEGMFVDQPIIKEGRQSILITKFMEQICPVKDCPAQTCPSCPDVPECPRPNCPSVPNYKRIKTMMGSKRCLNVSWDYRDDALLVLNDCVGLKNQNFYFDDKDRIVVEFTGKCLEVDNRNKNAGNLIGQRTCNDNQSQKWKLTDTGNLVSLFSGKCMDIPGAKDIPGQNIMVWDCHDGLNQKWMTE